MAIANEHEPFSLVRKTLKMVGITMPKQSAYIILCQIIRYFFIIINLMNLSCTMLYLVMTPTSLVEKLLPLIYCVANTHVSFNQIMLIRQEDTLKEFLRTIEALINRESMPVHKEMLDKEFKRSKFYIFLTFCINLSFLPAAMAICALENYIYHKNKLPFYIYGFLDGKRYPLATWIYEFTSMFCPVLTMAVESSFLIVGGKTLAALLKILRINLVNRRAKSVVGRSEQIGCYKFHADIMKCVGTFNEMYSFQLLLQIFFCSLQCCLGGYAIFKGGDHSLNIVTTFLVFCNTMAMPWTICAIGNSVTVESERIFVACYQNLWYTEDTFSKKELLIMMTAATQPLYLHYRFLVKCDMERCSMIMSAAYSYTTLLQMMDF